MAAICQSTAITARTSMAGKQLRTAPKRAAVARSAMQVVAADRPLWLPGWASPAHLDGTLPGDFGFDPFNLGADEENLKWFQQAELMHCRWAMMGVAGILFPEAASMAGDGDFPVWTEAGAVANQAGAVSNGLTLFWMQMILMNWAELRRWQDMKNPGSVSQDPIFPQFGVPEGEVGYPGGRWFNPFSMGADPAEMAKLKVREIKNGRVAMVAIVGFSAQSFTTGAGPLTNLMQHLADPGHVGIFSNMGV